MSKSTISPMEYLAKKWLLESQRNGLLDGRLDGGAVREEINENIDKAANENRTTNDNDEAA